MFYIVSDVDFLNNQWRDTLNEFKEDYEKWERHTLKDYLTRCAEIINNQIKYNMIDIKINGISSYLYAQLNKEGITVSDRHIQKILPEDYKRNYNKTEDSSELTEQKWKTIETDDPSITIEKNQYNNIKINVALAKSSPIGVDTEEDFLAIKKIMEYKS